MLHSQMLIISNLAHAEIILCRAAIYCDLPLTLIYLIKFQVNKACRLYSSIVNYTIIPLCGLVGWICRASLGTFTCTLFFSFRLKSFRLKDSVDCLHETLSNPIWCLYVPALPIGMTLWHAHISLCPVFHLLHVSTWSCNSMNLKAYYCWKVWGKDGHRSWLFWWLCVSKEHLIYTPPSSEQKPADEGP